MNSGCCLILAIGLALLGGQMAAAQSPPWLATAQETVTRVDQLLEKEWAARGIIPAKPVDDRGLLRRAWLDLVGRIPTLVELKARSSTPLVDTRRQRLVELIESPEFALHFGRVLDVWIQSSRSGDDAFLGWLRQEVEARAAWDTIFCKLIVPSSDTDGKLAARFITKRVKNIDQLTSDTARVFFGVDITCARCHDHPLVDEWKQDHYYGLSAFLHRASEQGKNSGVVIDKPDGEVTFARRTGQQQTAALMFLSGQKLEPAAKQNRRELLVSAAIAEQQFFSRAAVNRVWAWFFGRGLIHPVDQMHAGNPAAMPAVLDTLAADFVASGYDLRQLVGAIVMCKAYEMSSQTETASPPEAFAAYRLKPLTPWQWSLSFVTATSNVPDLSNCSRDDRRQWYLEQEKTAVKFASQIDPAGEHFQSAGYQATTAEALYLAHHAGIQQQIAPAEHNLAARLMALPSAESRVTLSWQTILGRDPTSEERNIITATTHDLGNDAQQVAALVWTVVTSPEFRFNH